MLVLWSRRLTHFCELGAGGHVVMTTSVFFPIPPFFFWGMRGHLHHHLRIICSASMFFSCLCLQSPLCSHPLSKPLKAAWGCVVSWCNCSMPAFHTPSVNDVPIFLEPQSADLPDQLGMLEVEREIICVTLGHTIRFWSTTLLFSYQPNTEGNSKRHLSKKNVN